MFEAEPNVGELKKLLETLAERLRSATHEVSDPQMRAHLNEYLKEFENAGQQLEQQFSAAEEELKAMERKVEAGVKRPAGEKPVPETAHEDVLGLGLQLRESLLQRYQGPTTMAKIDDEPDSLWQQLDQPGHGSLHDFMDHVHKHKRK